MTLQRIGLGLIETPVEITASAEVGPNLSTLGRRRPEGHGEFTNRIEMRGVGKPKTKQARKRYRRDKTVEGRGRKKVMLTTTSSKLFLVDAMAERREISRSELIRIATKRYAEATPRAKDPPPPALMYCISIPADDLAAIDAEAEARGISRSEYVRRATEHYAAHNNFPDGDP